VPFLAPKEFLASPDAGREWASAESLRYTRWLATHHYENFPVVSILLPKELHQDFFNVYAFCRWADDLGDEIGDPVESLRLLAWWRGELLAMYRGEVRHPVFVALRDTVERRSLPEKPFDDLIRAFEQDQTKTRYADWTEILAYCECSANPVGRLVLMLAGHRDVERFRMSDATCTGLQLANFWQDVTVDWEKDRVYLPQDLLSKHGVSDADIASRNFTSGFREVMREAVEYARQCFAEGVPLAATLDRRLALDIELFTRGGMMVLDKIERQGFDVLRERPKITKVEKAWLVLRGLSYWARQRIA
jgi:squalene synthase HpnC